MDTPKHPRKGRPTAKQAKNLQVVQALMETKNPVEAYMKLHPNSTRESAAKNVSRMLSPEVMDEFKRLMAMDGITIANRENIEKFLLMVVVGWTQGKEKTQDFLKAVDLLKNIAPDVAQKMEVVYKDEDAINKRIKELGFNPDGTALS